MASTVQASFVSTLQVTETLDQTLNPAAPDGSRVLTYSNWNTSKLLSGATTPPVTATVNFQQALSTGAATIDLTAVPGANGVSQSLTGLKPRFIKLQNPATNANNITVAKGASNGYTPSGSAFSVTIVPGGELLMDLGANGLAIGSGAKTLDLTGTGSQALNVQIVAGT